MLSHLTTSRDEKLLRMELERTSRSWGMLTQAEVAPPGTWELYNHRLSPPSLRLEIDKLVINSNYREQETRRCSGNDKDNGLCPEIYCNIDCGTWIYKDTVRIA